MVGVGMLVASFAAGCSVEEGSGIAATETRTISKRFERLEITTVNARIEVDPTATGTTLVVNGDDNLLRRVRTTVDDDWLKVEVDDDVDSKTPLEVVLKAPRLTEIEGAGTSRITLKLEGDSPLIVKGAGKMQVTATGRVSHLDVDLAGDARLHARQLTARSVDLDAAGDSFAEVCATDRLVADVGGTADVDYYCNPGDVDDDVGDRADLHRR
jgi:hypothetical protein